MGLDMYLRTNSKRLCQEINDADDALESILIPRGIAIQWRKANAIHKWFVDTVQGGNDDCGIYEVEVGELAMLHDTCKRVLESTRLVDAYVENGETMDADGSWKPIIQNGQKLEDASLAMELLPTQSGFFYGSTDYDQGYWWDLMYTVEKLGRLLDCLEPKDPFNVVHKDEPDWFVRFYYTSSY